MGTPPHFRPGTIRAILWAMSHPRRFVALAVSAVLLPFSLAGCSLLGGGGPTPPQVAESYFTALADGDAKAAIKFLSVDKSESTLLTDDVLAASLEAAPLDDIEIVDEGQKKGSVVDDLVVGFTLGGEPYESTLSLNDYDGDNVWEITSGGVNYIEVYRFQGLGLTINGTPFDGEEAMVFPGTYELGLAGENFTLGDDPVVTAYDGYNAPDMSLLEPTLTEAGLAAFRSVVHAAVDACIASTALAAGCGLDIPGTLSDGTQMSDGTISRTLSAEAITTIDSMVPTLSFTNPTLAEGEFIGGVTTSGQCTQNGQSGTCSVLFGPSLGRPSVDMGADDLTVLWD